MSRSARISLSLLAAMAAGTVALAAAFWLGRGSAASGETLTLYVSGDTRGYLEPCGCRRDQAGGLPGRMTLVRQYQGDRLLVDVGSLTSGDRPHEILKLEYLLRGMQLMGYDAVNLGGREAGLDRDTLRGILQSSQAPFVSCNVLDRSTGRPLAPAHRIVRAAGVQIGITGVVHVEDDAAGPGILVRPPAEALAEVLPRLRSQCDYVLVLAWADGEALNALASRFHEIDCLLGGDVPQSSERAERINRAVAFNVTEKGKVLGKLRFARTSQGLELAESRAVRVVDTIPPAPEMLALLKEYRAVLRDRNIELAASEGLEPISAASTTSDTYAGEASCAPCHSGAHQAGVLARHAHAYETLVRKGAEYDPDCLRCHTVGYGARDGFVNLERTPHLASVQCENCHGRGGDHARAMRAGARRASSFRPVTPNTCIRCHDEENDGDFSYPRDWAKIRHGAG